MDQVGLNLKNRKTPNNSGTFESTKPQKGVECARTESWGDTSALHGRTPRWRGSEDRGTTVKDVLRRRTRVPVTIGPDKGRSTSASSSEYLHSAHEESLPSRVVAFASRGVRGPCPTTWSTSRLLTVDCRTVSTRGPRTSGLVGRRERVVWVWGPRSEVGLSTCCRTTSRRLFRYPRPLRRLPFCLLFLFPPIRNATVRVTIVKSPSSGRTTVV